MEASVGLVKFAADNVTAVKYCSSTELTFDDFLTKATTVHSGPADIESFAVVVCFGSSPLDLEPSQDIASAETAGLGGAWRRDDWDRFITSWVDNQPISCSA